MCLKQRSLSVLIVLSAAFFGVHTALGALNVSVLDLDGNGDYVYASDSDNLTNFPNGVFTIQAWIFVQQLGLNQPIVSKYQETGNQRSWAFLVTSQGQLRAYVSGDGTAAGTYMWQTTSAVVPSDVWCHVAFVCNPQGADKIKFYVNNVEKTHTNTSVDPPASVYNSTALMWVGRFLNQYFYGYIDELRISSEALTSFPSSVLDVPLTPELSTEVLYHFDESSGLVKDHSNLYGNPSNNGTLAGNASRRAWNSLGPSNDLPLPVTLIALAASPGDQTVKVTWSTETEIDNLGYYIYRSTNQSANYSRINAQLVPSKGFSMSTQSYQYQDDRDLINGITYYYKISDVDVNGRERIHETIASATPSTDVMLPGESASLADYQLSQNFPNPFNATTAIRYYVRNPGLVHLSVYNLAGEEIAVLVNEIQAAGEHMYEFDATPYPSGIYFVRLIGEQGYDNIKKMLFLK